MIDDAEMADLLAEHAARQRAMTLDEKTRIQDRLGLAADISAMTNLPPSTRAVSQPIDISSRGASQPRARVARPIMIAATLVALVGLASLLFVVGNDGAPTIAVVAETEQAAPTPTPAPSPTPLPPPVCPSTVVEFVMAVDGWDGIMNWADLIDERRPDPDLPTLAAAAVVEWRTLAPSDPLHRSLDIPVDEPETSSDLSAQDISALRAEPIQLAFNQMRLAAATQTGPIGPCSDVIEAVALELELPTAGSE